MSGALVIRDAGAIATGDVRMPLVERGHDVHIVDGRITAITPNRGAAPTGGGKTESQNDTIEAILDARDMLLAPGLWDAHHHPYFGDHTPHFDARGYLEATVRAGTTTIVSAGTVDVPGRPRDAVGARELATLAQRSWLHDRPLDLKVLAGTVVATTGLDDADFARLATLGIRRLSFVEPLPTAAEARRQSASARARGLTVMAHCAMASVAGDAASAVDVLRAIEPDVALGVNGRAAPPPDDVLDWLVERSGAALDLDLMGNVAVAARIVARVAARGELERVVIGTATPSRFGIVPGGVQRMLQHLVGAAPDVTPAVALALASGNTARTFAMRGGRVAAGEPADLILCRAPRGAPYRTALDALARGGWVEIDTLLIDGAIQVSGDARLQRTASASVTAT
jgi:enamidase